MAVRFRSVGFICIPWPRKRLAVSHLFKVSQKMFTMVPPTSPNTHRHVCKHTQTHTHTHALTRAGQRPSAAGFFYGRLNGSAAVLESQILGGRQRRWEHHRPRALLVFASAPEPSVKEGAELNPQTHRTPK